MYRVQLQKKITMTYEDYLIWREANPNWKSKLTEEQRDKMNNIYQSILRDKVTTMKN